MPGAMDFVRIGNQIVTVKDDEVGALKMIHFRMPESPSEDEKQNDKLPSFPENIMRKIEQIINAEDVSVRIDLMLSMIKSFSRSSNETSV